MCRLLSRTGLLGSAVVSSGLKTTTAIILLAVHKGKAAYLNIHKQIPIGKSRPRSQPKKTGCFQANITHVHEIIEGRFLVESPRVYRPHF